MDGDSSPFKPAVDFVLFYLKNFWRNATHMFDGMEWTRWLRLVAIIGAYVLIRPYLERYAAKYQEKQYAKIDKDHDIKEAQARAAMSANELRGGPRVVEVDEDEAAGTTGADWGKAAKKKQKQTKKVAAEKAKQEEDEDSWSDPDVSDLLT